MIQNELRKANGAYKPKVMKVYHKLSKILEEFYEENKDLLSYDMIHLLITDTSYSKRTFKIALEA